LNHSVLVDHKSVNGGRGPIARVGPPRCDFGALSAEFASVRTFPRGGILAWSRRRQKAA
jgi:hypothetical protein